MNRFVVLLLMSVVLLAACSKQNPPLTTPTGLKAIPGDKKLTLSWTANPEIDLKGYLLTWQTADGNDKGVKEVGLATSAVIDGLQNGVAYLVRVAAEDLGGYTSPPSNPVAAVPVGPAPTTAPATPTSLKATAQDGQVTLTWTANFEPDLNHYTLFWGPDSKAQGQFAVIPAPANSYVVKGLTNGTPYFFALEAENTLGLTSPRSAVVMATPKAAPMAPVVNDIKITVTSEGNAVELGLGKQVRQGMGAITLTLEGSRLDTLSSARLGDILFTVGDHTEGSATLTGVVEHGAFLGEQVLVLENDGGSASVEDAAEITRITSAAAALFNPSDTCFDPTDAKSCGLGTPNRPFRTLSKALSVAGSGDTVLLTAGTYGAGETWPQSSGIPAPNVPAGVSIEGQSSDRNSVLLQGPGKTSGYSGLVFVGDATVKNLSLRGFKYALILRQDGAPQPTGTLNVYNVDSSANFDGVHVYNAASLSIQDSVFIGNGDDSITSGGSGIYVAGPVLFDIGSSTPKATRVEGNVYGIFIDQGPFGKLNDVEVTQNIRDGVFVSRAGVDINNSDITENGFSGVYLSIPDFDHGMSIAGSVLSGNKQNGLHVVGNPLSVDLNGCRLENNSDWQLFDQRDANNLLTLFSVNTSYQGVVPYTNTNTKVTSGTGGFEDNTGSKKLYRIDKVGNSIEFDSL